MASMPRIITVDPTMTLSRLMRAAIELLDQPVIQVDAPSAAEALDEVERGCTLMVAAYELDDSKAPIFALNLHQKAPDTAVLVVGDVDDPDDLLDEETFEDSPFLYLKRPLDTMQFMRVVTAGISSGPEAMMQAYHAPTTGGGTVVEDMGPIPALDPNKAQPTVDGLLTELGAMAIVLATRDGSVLLERGAVGYIDREKLTRELLPVMKTNIGVKDLVGGEVSTLHFYDGEDYDVFVLTVGLHHFMCVMFDGQQGARQFGLVNRFGRKAVQDLIALLGAQAFLVMPPQQAAPEAAARKRPARARKQAVEDEGPIELAPAELDIDTTEEAEPEVPEPAVQMEPIGDLDLDLLFGEGGGDLDADALFDPDALEELAKDAQPQQRETLNWDDAEKLKILRSGKG